MEKEIVRIKRKLAEGGLRGCYYWKVDGTILTILNKIEG